MPAPTYKFGDFDLDTTRFELRRDGLALKVERIPLELLILLVEKDGQLVSRQEIIERLWGKDVFVDTEHGINTAIRKIRTALREDVERPRFIQTISGKGYRFVPETPNANGNRTAAPAAEGITATSAVLSPPSALASAATTSNRSGLKWLWLAIGFLILAGALMELNVAGLRDRVFARSQIGPIHSIAVLPLANLSGDASQDYYADGMTDELITALAQNRSLRVVSRTSAMQYKGVNKPLREIAQALGVDGILEGSVNRSANDVHMNLQLIYGPTDTHVWAKSYDRDINSAVSLPDELAQVIASQARISPGPLKPKRPISAEAKDAYLRGRYAWFNANYDKSEEYLKKAVELQPDYAAAWCGLGDNYAARAVEGQVPPGEAFEKMRELTQKALQLDDSSPDAHTSWGAGLLFNRWDFRGAEAEELRAIELNPSAAEPHHLYSYILTALNRHEEEIKEEKRSMELDPFARPWGLGFQYVFERQYDAAIAEFRARGGGEPQDPNFQFGLAWAYEDKGMYAESAHELERGFQITGDKKSATDSRIAFERDGIRGLREWSLKRDLEKLRKKKYVSSWNLAVDYARLGRKQETLSALENAYEERSPWIFLLQKARVFDFVHSDERYRALVKNIGLPPAY